ncbi:MAG: hypothetical protein ACREM3_31365 [Candidatus Rokuibacteriota bacterium]
MLAERFEETLVRTQNEATERQQARSSRDDFIGVQFPRLDAAFVAMVRDVTGTHPRLAVVTTPVTETFTGRGFATLTRTVIEVRSTLYGAVEGVRFTPGLESIALDQFGVIKVGLDNLTPSFVANGTGPLFRSMVDRGVLMRGATAAGLVVARDTGFEPLTSTLLEAFLTALFVRT